MAAWPLLQEGEDTDEEDVKDSDEKQSTTPTNNNSVQHHKTTGNRRQVLLVARAATMIKSMTQKPNNALKGPLQYIYGSGSLFWWF